MPVKKGGKTLSNSNGSERREGYVRETTLHTRAVKKEGGSGVLVTGAEIPLQPMVQTRMSQWRSVVEQISTYSLWKISNQNRWRKSGSLCCSRLLLGLVALWRMELSVEGLLAGFVTLRGTHAGAVCS